MSREHASIFYQDGSFFIRDLNSSNGAFSQFCLVSKQYKIKIIIKDVQNNLFDYNLYTKSFIVYVNIGTYLILEGKDKMCINKETNNSILEVFSGDVIQFGQGK